MEKVDLELKDCSDAKIAVSADDVSEMVPDADMRFTLLILKDGTKHFVKGTEQQIISLLDQPHSH